MMSVNKTIGERLRLARTEFNTNGAETMKEVSGSTPLPMSTVSAMESGKSLTPENLKILAEHYGVSLDYLFDIPGAVPNPDVEIQGVCRNVGLSEEAVKTLRQYFVFEDNTLPDQIICAKGYGDFIGAFHQIQRLNDRIQGEVDRVWNCIRSATDEELRDCTLDHQGLERDYKISIYELWESLFALVREIIPIENAIKSDVRRCYDALFDAQYHDNKE